MTLRNHTELANTREKLRALEERYKARSQETPSDPHVHELTLQSLKRTINQFREEIARYESRQPARGGMWNDPVGFPYAKTILRGIEGVGRCQPPEVSLL